jgi:large subunit ribosomal protein L19
MAKFIQIGETAAQVGDTVQVYTSVSEGDKTRTQMFEGILIASANRGVGKVFTVRKIGADGVGVERIFPVNAPTISQVKVKRRGSVRRSKLYFLRGRVGKLATKIKERFV